MITKCFMTRIILCVKATKWISLLDRIYSKNIQLRHETRSIKYVHLHNICEECLTFSNWINNETTTMIDRLAISFLFHDAYTTIMRSEIVKQASYNRNELFILVGVNLNYICALQKIGNYINYTWMLSKWVSYNFQNRLRIWLVGLFH